ncbi:MAG: OmpA family protein [Myxococcales bacterium]
MVRLILAALLLCTAATRAAAEDAEGCKDATFVPRFPGAVIFDCHDSDFDQVELPLGLDPNKDVVNKKLEGRVQAWRYNTAENKSAIQIARNFENAFKKAGAKILVGASDSANPSYVTAFYESKKTYVTIETTGGGYNQSIVTIKEMEQEVEVDAGALMDELNKSGHVAVYGIHFDTGKASLTEDSGKVLEQVAKLLADNAELKLRVEGHTDNVGKDKANLELSKKRAAAVKAWLVEHGADGKRLTADGFGSTKPLGDNKTEEGKAKNRRVELVKI